MILRYAQNDRPFSTPSKLGDLPKLRPLKFARRPSAAALFGFNADAFGLPLTVETSSTLDFGAGVGANNLTFGNSQLPTWGTSTTLTIANHRIANGGLLRFGSNASELSPTQLSAISFTGYAGDATIDSLGHVSPSAIPEPASVAALLGASALILALRRRQRAMLIRLHD